MKAHWLLTVLLAAGTAQACDDGMTPSDQVASNTEETGRFEIVRERAGGDGKLQIRVRAERLESADAIAKKLAEVKKSTNQRIGVVEFIQMKDPADAPTRRVIENP